MTPTRDGATRQRRDEHRPASAGGFSLTELLIVVAIIGILASLALPNYTRHVLKSRRIEAVDALMQIAAEQEKFYINNNAYAANLEDLGFQTGVSVNGYYALSLDATADTFTATAVPASDSPQNEDETCVEFGLNQQAMRSAKSSDGEDTTAECWR